MNKTLKRSKIVALGGGTGLANLLRGLKKYSCDITAVVAVTDDGGSSGRLRRELGILPPGDIRNCLVALSQEENLMARLFQYRFPAEGSLAGHSFGNLFLTAMSAITGGFDKAIYSSGEVLAISGRVLPVTLKSVTLSAGLADGNIVDGETNISRSSSRVKTLMIKPYSPPAAPMVLDAIAEADCIIMGPGSLYTSVIANLLVEGVADAIAASKAARVYVSNIMTQPGETSGYTIEDHISAIESHAGQKIIDYIIVNDGSIPAGIAKRYAKEGSAPVKAEKKARFKARIIKADLVGVDEYARHNPDKLAAVIYKKILKKL